MNGRFVCCHYDIARGAYLKPEAFRCALDSAARAGFTHFLPYLENMIRLPSIEKACPSCAYGRETWREIEAAAAGHGLQMVGHFNVIGHSAHICEAYPELSGRAGEKEIDVTLAETKAWTVRCLEELCAFTDAESVLIGGDEWEAPRHLLERPGFDAGRAWVEQINLAVETLAARGRTAVVWHDMLMHYPATLERLSRRAVVAFWFYDVDSDYPVLTTFRKLGFRTLMATGTCSGLFSSRREQALRCALRAAERHAADGFMLTNWEETPWSRGRLLLSMAGRALGGQAIPAPWREVVDALETLEKTAPDSGHARLCRERIAARIDGSAWSEHADFRDHVRALLAGDAQREREVFLRHHFAEGPLYGRIGVPLGRTAAAAPSSTPEARAGFGVTDGASDGGARVLRVVNGSETFAVYPAYGGTLQDWRVGDRVVIAHALPRFLEERAPLPGGYRSYSAAGGLRPIWAMGTHSNPCTLWQGAFSASIETCSGDRIVLLLARDMPHVAVTYRLEVRRGIPGFTFDAKAVSLQPHAYGAFNFNCPFALEPGELDGVELCWREGGRARCMRIREQCSAFFVMRATDGIHVRKAGVTLDVESDPGQTAGFYVDWGVSYVTPDVHGVYRPMPPGAETRTRWTFAAKAP